MAKADDTTSTSDWISWRDALMRAGSSEALLSYLRKRPILARHQGLYYWPSGKKRSEHGKIDPDWWAQARVDPATSRVIFLVPEKYQLFFAGFAGDPAPPAVVPRARDEVFAFGIELERGAVETRFPAQPNPPEPEHVEVPEPLPAPAPSQEKTRAEWLAETMKTHQKRRAENVSAWARRLQGLAQNDPTVEAWPDWESLRRDLYRQMDK